MFTVIHQSISCQYGGFQQWMLNPEYSTINCIEGLPDMTSLDPTKVNFVIIDDLMHEMNEVMAKLFTKGSHHRNTKRGTTMRRRCTIRPLYIYSEGGLFAQYMNTFLKIKMETFGYPIGCTTLKEKTVYIIIFVFIFGIVFKKLRCTQTLLFTCIF